MQVLETLERATIHPGIVRLAGAGLIDYIPFAAGRRADYRCGGRLSQVKHLCDPGDISH
jgi:hypothetical protein